MLSDIRAAIFDLDGTLIDSMGVWERVDRSFLMQHGFADDPYYIEALRNRNYREAAEFTISYLHLDMQPRELMEEWDAMAVWEYGHTIPLKPGARELLDDFRSAGCPIVLATVSHAGLYEAVLKRHGIYDYFAGFTDESMANLGKDRPDIYQQAASIAGFLPKQCIVFEDILKGIRSAHAAGFVTCAVEDFSQSKDREALMQTADYYVQDLIEAREIVFGK